MFGCHGKRAANGARLLLIAADVDDFEFLTALQFYDPFPSVAISAVRISDHPIFLQRCLVMIREPLSAMHYVVLLYVTLTSSNSTQACV